MARLAGRDLPVCCAIGGERPARCCRHDWRGQTCASARYDWRGEICAARLAGRPARRDWRGETCAARLTGRDLRGAIKVQIAYRGHVEPQSFLRTKRAAIKGQATARMHLQRVAYTAARARLIQLQGTDLRVSATRLAGRDLRCAIGGERPARRDWRGETCAARLRCRARTAGTSSGRASCGRSGRRSRCRRRLGCTCSAWRTLRRGRG